MQDGTKQVNGPLARIMGSAQGFTVCCYTFMANHTESQIACRGKNKAGKHNLRQFEAVMDEMFGIKPCYNSVHHRLQGMSR